MEERKEREKVENSGQREGERGACVSGADQRVDRDSVHAQTT